ncbi:hypothetical protein DOTSEDRAFT_74152 [Dothistroma septosporum NZE10]|uniref:UBL3-like ubiquitin domain-containing protein n=1 Tax=Dothistroma septosporum (strain NZE10 / CBS 128990) TaxID=675120 RepID=N1PFX4_DOTSN|nr:hypothetical protein DOTSEDRAFT_74152 [Dothistroma septosporum NZE10]
MVSSQPDAVAGAPVQSVTPTTQIATAVERPLEINNTPPTPGDQRFEDAVQQQPEPSAQPTGTTGAPQLPPVEAHTQPLSTAIEQSPLLTRKETEALGPAADEAEAHSAGASGPQLSISLMLTTGARHPYKIDEKYLRNRKVEAKDANGAFDPKAISGYQLKELIWTDWRSEWEPRPTSPSSIRLILLGRMVEDKSLLRDLPFKSDSTNVVHMTVKPADLIDDEDTAGKGTGKSSSTRMRDTEDRGAGCRCVVQ